MRPAAGIRTDDDVRLAIAVHIGRRHVHATREPRIKCEEAKDFGPAVAAVDDFDVRPAAGTGSGDDVRNAVAPGGRTSPTATRTPP